MTSSDAPLPEMVYHYTTAMGLKGIVENQEIWLTDLRFLNDRREMTYGRDQLLSAISTSITENLAAKQADAETFQAEPAPRPDAKVSDALVQLDAAVARRTAESPEARLKKLLSNWLSGAWATVLVACFTEKDDSLGQWRGYSAGGGFALGFDFAELSKTLSASSSHLELSKVVYEPERQRGLALEWAEQVVRDWSTALGDFSGDWASHLALHELKATGSEYQDALKAAQQTVTAAKVLRGLRAAAVMKHPSFDEEQEWRISVTSKTKEEAHALEFRLGGIGLLPYLVVPLKSDASGFPLRSITVGPGVEEPTRQAAVRMLLEKHGLPEVSVERSNVPFRP